MEALTDSQTQKVLTLIEVCGVDFESAKTLLQASNYNLQTATQLHFNPTTEQVQSPPKPVQEVPYQTGGYYQNDYQDDDDPAYIRYRNFRTTGSKFEDRYPVEETGVIKSIFNKITSRFRGETLEGEKFVQKLQEIYPGQNKVNFNKGRFLNAMYQAKNQNFPLLVFLYDFSDKIKPLVKTMISNPNVADFFNVSFRIIGIDASNPDLDKTLMSLVDRSNIPCIAVLKVDECEEIVPMDIVELGPDTEIKELKQRLNKSKSQYIKDEIRQSEYFKKFANQLKGIYGSQIMTFERRLEIQQERKLRQQQESDLKQVNLQLQRKKNEQQDIKQMEKQKQQKTQTILQQRDAKRKAFKTYTQGIRLRIRVPSGGQSTLVVPPEEKVQFLFDYVQTLEDCGFEDDINRKFDIIRPYDKLTLHNSRHKTLAEVFGQTDGQNLAVTQT